MRMSVLQKLNTNSATGHALGLKPSRNHKTQEIDQCADTETKRQ
jgi:hypothetical protein